MLDYFRQLWETSSLSPHGICLLWRPELIWTHVGADALIGLAYYSIPLALAYFVSRRSDIRFGWVFWAFAMFILACGTTHLISIYTLWVPDYGTEALIKIVTAALSVFTAVALWVLLPQALAIPSAASLRRLNDELVRQIDERNAALAELQAEKAERFKTEEMLRQSQKMEAVGQLTGGLAHDFNNLMTVVVGNLERLEQKFSDDPAVSRAVKGAMQGAERGAALTRKLLAFGRRQPLAPQRVDANALVENIADLVKRALGDGIAVETDLAAGIWPIETDPNQLENVVLNLAVNARDAMPAGGSVTVTTRNVVDPVIGGVEVRRGPYVMLMVADTGAGMTKETLAHVFEPFFTTKPVGEGSGLGLSQVYGFVKQSNGYIDIDSTPGAGTTLRVYLPRMAAVRPAPATDGNVGPITPLGQAG